MQKTKCVLHFVYFGKEYRVIRYYGETNSYRIYHYFNDYNKRGVITEHKKLMAKYDNLASCFCWFLDHNIGF